MPDPNEGRAALISAMNQKAQRPRQRQIHDAEVEFEAWLAYLKSLSPRELVLNFYALLPRADDDSLDDVGLDLALTIVRMCILRQECPELC